MLPKQVTGQHGSDIWIALSLAILGALLYGFTVFQYDYFRVLKRGENGQAAIAMLDQMRRPFLTLKQAELRLLQSAGESSAISGIESAIHDGRQKLLEYLKLASYNEEARKKIVQLEASYEAWVSLELELVRRRAFFAAGPDMWTEHGDLDALVRRNSSAFLTVMDVLADGEEPIHHDIEAGAAAVRGLLASSLAFITYLIVVGFWREWVKHRRERLRYESELRLHRLAHMDSLTELPNRALFYDRLRQAIGLAKRDRHELALLYLDLDKFKAVNDTLGHPAGDELLTRTAERVRRLVRESDTVARIGGDEFTVILPRIASRQDAAQVAEKIIGALSAPFHLGEQKQEARIGTSIGIAIYPADAQDMDELVKAADTAMYNAKQARNTFRFYAKENEFVSNNPVRVN